MSRLALRSLVLSLVFQIAFGSSLPLFAQASDHQDEGSTATDRLVREGQEQILADPDARARVRNLEALASQIENATETTPPSGTRDAWLLTGQTAAFRDGESFAERNLSQYNLTLPTVAISDFQEDIQVEMDRYNGLLHFNKKRGDVLEARHTIRGVRVVAHARDRELLQFVDESGQMYAIDMVLAQTLVFKAPIPIFKLAQTPASVTEALRHGAALEGRYVLRSLRELADMEISGDAVVPHEVLRDMEPGIARRSLYRLLRREQVLVAGDFVLTSRNQNGTETLHGVYDRQVTQTQVYSGEGVLAVVANGITPDGGENAAEVNRLLGDENVRAASGERAAQELGVEETSALRAYSASQILRMTVRASSNRERRGAPRDSFLLRELESETLQLPAQIEQPSAEEVSQRTLRERLRFFRASLTPKQLGRIALLTAVGAGSTAFALTANDIGPAWAVHAANQIWDNYGPEVLKDSAYRFTLLKSTLSLLALTPALKAIYTLAGKKLRNWDFLRTFSTVGIRIYAQIQLSFLHRFAQIFRQSNLIEAMRAGINPLARAGSTGTSTFPAFNAPWAASNRLDANRQAIESVTARRERVRTMAWALAGAAVAERSGVDVATITALQRGDLEGLSDNELVQRLRSPEFQQAHQRLARELYFVIRNLPQAQAELAQVPVQEWETLYTQAKNLAERINSRNGLQRAAANLRLGTQESLHDRIWRGIGNWGYDSYQYLRQVEPSTFVQNQVWDQFKLDFAFSIVQVAVVGERTDLSRPEELAASEGHFMWTTPQHWSDMANQVAIYGISVPARYAQVFQMEAQPTEEAYQPVENAQMQSVQREAGFFSTMAGWLRGATDLRRAEYGFLAAKAFDRRVRTIQAGFIMDMVCRTLFAGQDWANAAPAFIYTVIWAQWVAGWHWDIVNRGSQLAEGDFEARLGAYQEAKRKISQGLRLDNAALAREGYVEMNRLYAEHNKDIDPALRQVLRDAESLLDVPAEQLLASRERIAHYTGAVAQLGAAMDALDSERSPRVQEAYDRLKSLYAGENVAFDTMDAQALLEYSLHHPPVFIQGDTWGRQLPVLLASFSTTYMFTIMSTDSYRAASWSDKIAHYGMLSAALYSGMYYGQKALNRLVDSWRSSSAAQRQAIPAAVEDAQVTSVCEVQMLPEAQRPIVSPESSLSERVRSFLRRARGEPAQ